ncbi:exo-beta-1,3-glucanase Exg0 [Aspergillus clavatus NRRL 1]|uniref:Exo-beta-1,3-glucanase Exg0 n=1 Tax=Aspergillus clavatus (strain ATCC 1007 / CBS 513.65 / DSM 816 / NCTC 3887 / NRRL 1 / QM 1276 / 107) TaxID=344612 RepID=A1CP18_ASPCL|nr:exo-beta-1,3-glucanase Exg0 [Aspergillus clavatus NRRL 1]EAW07389.1 exo-beta-1,3-glucanase Exg0 [Aspergillus clavatus NRRL 1]
MASHTSIMLLLAHILLFLGVVNAVPTPQSLYVRAPAARDAAGTYWVANIKRQGAVPFGKNPDYQVFRNVKDFGAKGDGVTDDTVAINQAIASGDRCGKGCDSSTTTPALVYFPPGTYVVSKPILQYYYTQIVGDAVNLPVIKAAPGFQGMAVIDSDPYENDGSNWFTNQNNFFRSIRNLVIDLTAMPQGAGAGIHWQVGQATSLQNIRFEMVQGGGEANRQQGIFMDNGSGGFMSDLTFNGGNYGMFLGNQQFTTRNLVFNNCNTAIYMNWNWAWTLKSVSINNCKVGLNMSNVPQNQTVGSVLLLDSKLVNTPTGVITAFSQDSIPVGGGVLVLDNVDFTGSTAAVADVNGKTILPGGSVVASWIQGNAYSPSKTLNKRATQPKEHVVVETIVETVVACAAEYPEPTETSPAEAWSTNIHPPIADPAQSTQAAGETGPFKSIPTVVPTGSGSLTEKPSVPAGTIVTGSSLPGESNGTPDPARPTSSKAIEPSHHGPQSSATIASGGASHGARQCVSQAVTKTRLQTVMPQAPKPAALLAGDKVFERSKPLYTDYPASSFISVKSAGAKGDGQTDDTVAIQKVLNSATEDQIVYFDHGAYIITDTIKVPKNIKITGEIWPLIMAHGEKFADEHNPIPLLQIGEVGDKGSVEITDLVIQTKGPAPGAILMEWNVAGVTQGAAGSWDVHFRIGGSAGTELQSDKCSKTPESTTKPNPECIASFMLLHITEQASAYIENNWFWTADHELDLPDHNQINVYNGRGVLVESTGPVWMYGTSSEHHQLYNYQVTNAQNVFMALIQTETPYYQSNPDALTPFTPQASWHDPTFAQCTTAGCRKAWGLRVMNTSDMFVYGAGLYSFFENYEQSCLATESCQENMVEVDCSDIHLYGLSTKASTNMITSSDGAGLVPQDENRSNFCSTIALFEQS